MTSLMAILSILGALLLGAISPGPSFVLVARTAIASSRRAGLTSALGMGVGGVIFAELALLGLQALLGRAIWLYAGFKLLGGCYLLYLAVRLWRHADAPLSDARDGAGVAIAPGRSFWVGLGTQLSNPKTAVVYSSIFAALLPAQHPIAMVAILPPLVFMVEAGWYTVVALAFSSAGPRATYLRSKTWIDRLAGTAMGLLGLRLVVDAVRTS